MAKLTVEVELKITEVNLVSRGLCLCLDQGCIEIDDDGDVTVYDKSSRIVHASRFKKSTAKRIINTFSDDQN